MEYAKEMDMEEEKDDGKIEKWEVDCAVDAIIRAEEIKKNPKLFPLVKEKLLEKQKNIKTTIRSLSDLKKVAEEKSKEDSEEA
jgi:hypothetical protein